MDGVWKSGPHPPRQSIPLQNKSRGNYRSLIETLPRISLFFLAHLDLLMALKPGGGGDLLPPTSGSPYGGFLKPGGGGGSGSLVAAAAVLEAWLQRRQQSALPATAESRSASVAAGRWILTCTCGSSDGDCIYRSGADEPPMVAENLNYSKWTSMFQCCLSSDMIQTDYIGPSALQLLMNKHLESH